MTDKELKYARNRIRYWDLRQSDLVGWVEHVIERVKGGEDFETVAWKICHEEIARDAFLVMEHVAVSMGLKVTNPTVDSASINRPSRRRCRSTRKNPRASAS